MIRFRSSLRMPSRHLCTSLTIDINFSIDQILSFWTGTRRQSREKVWVSTSERVSPNCDVCGCAHRFVAVMTDYAAASSGILGPVAIQDLFRWRLEKLDAEGFDFSVFDADFDYWLDGLIIIHSGLPAEIGYVSCGDIITDRLWSQATGTPSGDWKSVDQYELQGYAIVPGWGVKNLCDRPPMVCA